MRWVARARARARLCFGRYAAVWLARYRIHGCLVVWTLLYINYRFLLEEHTDRGMEWDYDVEFNLYVSVWAFNVLGVCDDLGLLGECRPLVWNHEHPLFSWIHTLYGLYNQYICSLIHPISVRRVCIPFIPDSLDTQRKKPYIRGTKDQTELSNGIS